LNILGRSGTVVLLLNRIENSVALDVDLLERSCALLKRMAHLMAAGVYKRWEGKWRARNIYIIFNASLRVRCRVLTRL
jgi:hypothetical protein